MPMRRAARIRFVPAHTSTMPNLRVPNAVEHVTSQDNHTRTHPAGAAHTRAHRCEAMSRAASLDTETATYTK